MLDWLCWLHARILVAICMNACPVLGGMSFFMLQLRIHLANFLGVSERSGRVLGAEAAQKLYRHGYTFCKRYVALSNEALRPDMGVFFWWLRAWSIPRDITYVPASCVVGPVMFARGVEQMSSAWDRRYTWLAWKWFEQTGWISNLFGIQSYISWWAFFKIQQMLLLWQSTNHVRHLFQMAVVYWDGAPYGKILPWLQEKLQILSLLRWRGWDGSSQAHLGNTWKVNEQWSTQNWKYHHGFSVAIPEE